MEEQAYAQKMSTAPREEGQIPRELQRQAAALDELHSVIAHLEARTNDIRMGRPEPGDTRQERPEPLRATLAGEVALRTESIEHATRRIQTLLNELEL